VQAAADYAKGANYDGGDHCGRYAWAQQLPLPQKNQYFPRDFNLVALSGTITGPQDSQDPLAASGDVTLNNFNINALQRELYAIVSGGTVKLTNGTIYGGVIHGGDLISTQVNPLPVYFTPTADQKGLPSGFSFATAKAGLDNMSSKIYLYDSNQVTPQNRQLTFHGDETEMNVFSVDAAGFNGTTTYIFDVPSTSAVIVNVDTGTTNNNQATISNASFNMGTGLRKLSAGNLLWNFSKETTSVTVGSAFFFGSILAPGAAISLSWGSLSGTAVGATINATSELYSSPYHVPANNLTLAKQYIKHVVIIMQENRSFDHYFGSFPNAKNGIPKSLSGKTYNCYDSCNCLDATAGTYKFQKTTQLATQVDEDLPHENKHFDPDVASANQIDANTLSPKAFLRNACQYQSNNSAITQEVLNHYAGDTSSDILYSYWQYAKNFVLQEKMFQSVGSYSPVEHNFMVSGWNADCSGAHCSGNRTYDSKGPYAWNNITNLLCGSGVSWKYYLGNDWKIGCTSCGSPRDIPGNCFKDNSDSVHEYWNPLGKFSNYTTNQKKGDTGGIDTLKSFYTALNNVGTTDPDGSQFPAVSWIVPGKSVSEHPRSMNGGTVSSVVADGEAYVTSILNAITTNPVLWQTTAVFLSWDDWGGFYDHMPPPASGANDPNAKYENTYGLRVPGLVISPWVSRGYIDSDNQFSHDAYLKFIEDVFLGGDRISPSAKPKICSPVDAKDIRSEAHENLSAAGNLLNDFNFGQMPRYALTGLKCSYK
jgi:phospholipase C